MDSSVILLEKQADNGGPCSSERHVNLEAKLNEPVEGDGFNVASKKDGQVPAEGDSLMPNSSKSPCVNGPASHYPEVPKSLDPSGGPHGEEPAPGVPGFHDTLKSSQGASAEGVVLRKEALQSLKLSLPMQETELCKHLFTMEAPLPHFLFFYKKAALFPFLSGLLHSLSPNII